MKRKIIWQDVLFMVGGFVFAPSLVVSIVTDTSIPIATSLPTALVLIVFVACYATLKLYLATFATSLTAICWFILVAQAIM